MKKTLIAITCGLVLALSASTAQAVAIGDADYLGSIDPGTASPTDEVNFINTLIGMAINTSIINPGPADDFFRSGNTCAALTGGACPAAVLAGAVKIDGTLPSINTDGWTWLYIKYGGDAHVWYVGDIDGTTLIPQQNTGGQGVSHISLYNPGVVVPDGGATLGLLGLGMLGLGYLRRRKQ